MNLSDDGLLIFNERFAEKNDLGIVIETPDQAVERLSRCAASVETAPNTKIYWHQQFQRMIDQKWFVPSTPIWTNMGKTGRLQQPGACFVLDVEDNLRSMYQTLLESAMIAKYGGGIGYNFSKIRPQGDLINSTKGRASGVVELIRLYDASAAMIKQGGVRKGAFMGILNCDHPELEAFIQSKTSGGLSNFNLSVGITDAFMQAVSSGEEWELQFRGQVRKSVAARQLWEKIISAAWSCGEPGLIFLDRIEGANPIPSRPMNSTNPCGEQPLSPGESCLLGSINLALMKEANRDAIHWSRLRETAQVAVRFLDNLIDAGEYAFDYITQETRAGRKIGIGILGLHDLLIQLKIPYDSPLGLRTAAQVMAFIRVNVDQASAELAEEKGSFPLWSESIFARERQPRRNASCLAIAPTGTISLLAGVEGYGIEPIFAIAYQKTYLQDEEPRQWNVFSPLFLEACNQRGISDDILEEVAKRGSCQEIKAIPGELQTLFKGALEIEPKDHLAMQAAMQKHVDNAISKTINLPSNAAAEMVADIYMEAWKQDLKGISVFRAGSRTGVIHIGQQWKRP